MLVLIYIVVFFHLLLFFSNTHCNTVYHSITMYFSETLKTTAEYYDLYLY